MLSLVELVGASLFLIGAGRFGKPRTSGILGIFIPPVEGVVEVEWRLHHRIMALLRSLMFEMVASESI